MKINGIGIIKKSEAMSILTAEGKQAVRDGEISSEELGSIYKYEMVKKNSKIGNCQDTFRRCYDWVPDSLKYKLTPGELGELVDQFYECYGAGKNEA